MSNQYEGKTGWNRVLFTAIFWVIFYVSQFVVAIVVVAQCAFTILTNKPNSQLLAFGDSMGRYIHEILRFVTFNSDRRPFPFEEFPKSDLAVPSE